MKTTTMIFSVLWLALACSGEEHPEAALGAVPSALAPEITSTAEADAIAALIDPDDIDVALAPEGLDDLLDAPAGELTTGDVLAALVSIAPEESLATAVVEGSSWKAETQEFAVELDSESYRVSIGRKEEQALDATETDDVDDASVSSYLGTFLLSLGAREQEIGGIDVRQLLSQARAVSDGTLGSFKMVAKAAWVTRRLGGIRVLGDRFHLSVTPQGELKRIKGHWTPINYAHSALASSISLEEFRARSADALADVGVNAERSPRIVLGTVYRVAHDETWGEIVELKGVATAIYDGSEDYSESSQTAIFDLPL